MLCKIVPTHRQVVENCKKVAPTDILWYVTGWSHIYNAVRHSFNIQHKKVPISRMIYIIFQLLFFFSLCPMLVGQLNACYPKHQGSWYNQLLDNHGIVDEQMVGLASVFLLFALQISSAKSSLTHRKIV